MASIGSVLVLVLLSTIGAVSVHSTIVNECEPWDADLQGEMGRVTITNCAKAGCILKKNTNPEVTIAFTPQRNVTELMNVASAWAAGPHHFPIQGVNGIPACDNVFEADGTTKAGCPLEAGKSYVYKKGFHVEPSYPYGNKVHLTWALWNKETKLTEAKQNVACFKIRVRIQQ